MAVVTISRQVGSGGTKIGENVARALGYHLADRTTIAHVLKDYSFPQFEQEYNSRIGFWESFTARGQERLEQRAMMFDMLTRVTLALARHGNVVILGRGSFAPLQGFDDIVNVRIRAPLSFRVARVMQERSVADRLEVETRVKEDDSVGAGFTRSVYGVSDDAAEFFDLVIDTGKITSETATSLLVEVARSLETPQDDGRRAQEIQVDEILASTVSKELRCDIAHT